MAPAASSPTMFLVDGRYSQQRHHDSAVSVAVPGTVRGLESAWRDYGRLPWATLLGPAIGLAREGIMMSDGLARSLKEVLPQMRRSPAAIEQFSRRGTPYEMGDLLKQPDLARTLQRIAARQAAGFYEGETAELIVKEVQARGGRMTAEDLRSYTVYRDKPLRGSYRGFELLAPGLPSSGGVVLLQCLNMLEADDLRALGFNSARYVHLVAEALRRAYADRARHLGDPRFVEDVPLERLLSKEYGQELRRTIREDAASVSSPTTFEWPRESEETTHLSVIDAQRNVVSLTYTLEDSYGSKIVVPGAGFLLNNEMGDFNAGPGLTDDTGLVGTPPNLAAPHKRMLSNMTPALVNLRQGGDPFLVLGSPGGRTIPATVLQVILNVIDFDMNVQEAVDAPRFHHQWLPDRIRFERHGLSGDTLEALAGRGHFVAEVERQGAVQAILLNPREGLLEGASDRRVPDGAAVGR